MRQSAVDEQGGAEIQVLVEGRGMDNMRAGANNWTAEMYPHRRGSKGESSRSTTPSLLEEEIGHVNGHENSSTHHPWENGSSNHKPIEHMAPEKVWDQKPWKHQKSKEHTISREREREHKPSNHNSVDCDSSKFKPQVHIYSNHKSTGHNLSNHKTNQHASSNHKPKDFISAHEKPHVSYHYNPQEHVSSYHKQHEHVHFNHKPRKSFTNHTIGESSLNAYQLSDRGANNSTLEWTVENNPQWIPSHSHLQEKEGENDYRVEMRFQPLDSVPQQNFGSGTKGSGLQGHNLQRLRQRNHEGKEWGLAAREGSMDSVQMLDTLNVGVDVEEWPLHRDITLSPPLTSSPEPLDQEVEHLNLIKANSVSKQGDNVLYVSGLKLIYPAEFCSNSN